MSSQNIQIVSLFVILSGIAVLFAKALERPPRLMGSCGGILLQMFSIFTNLFVIELDVLNTISDDFVCIALTLLRVLSHRSILSNTLSMMSMRFLVFEIEPMIDVRHAKGEASFGFCPGEHQAICGLTLAWAGVLLLLVEVVGEHVIVAAIHLLRVVT